VFYGRTEELALLEQWIIQERVRVVVLLGMGGIGKTAISVKLAQQIQASFEFVIWRSLRNAPPTKALLGELIDFLTNHSETDVPDTVACRISRLITHLRAKRCLVVLDVITLFVKSSATC
jgi:MinD superfamily P-loop ATPase